MEDSHTHILSLPDDPGTAFFAVYDGHGGANIGKYASKHLHKFIVKRPEYQSDITDALKKVSMNEINEWVDWQLHDTVCTVACIQGELVDCVGKTSHKATISYNIYGFEST